MSQLDKKIVMDIWKQSQQSIQMLRETINVLTASQIALGEIKGKEKREAFAKLEQLICSALDEIDTINKLFWELSIESLEASHN